MKPAFGFTHRYANAAVVLLFALVFVPLAARGSTSGVTYQGRILKPDGAPLAGSNVQFKLQIRTPDTNNCLMYEEIQALDMRNSNGQFALTINDGSGARTDSTSWGLDRIFANRGSFAFDPSTCASGSSYAPNTGDGRNLVVLFKDETMAAWEPIPAQKINFVPFAFEAKQVAGFAADSLLRVVGAGGDPLTGLAPLSNAQYNELLALLNGTSTQFTKSGQLNGVALPTMSAGEVLGWNGSAWVSQTASGGPNSVTTAMIQNAAVDSSKIATGAVGSTQIANSAVGTSQIAGNVSINTTGTLGSAITTTRDFKIYAASPSTFYVGMLADPTLAASYTLTWPLTAGSANQVLTTDGSGKLTWTSPSSAGITDLTSDVTATGPGSAAATVVSVGGSAAADVHTAELAANAATSLNTPNTIVKRDGSGGFAAGAVSASSVTSTGAVSGGSVASLSTITATGAISGASVAATGAVSGATVTASGAVTQGSSVFKDSGSNTVTIQAPTTVSSSYVLKWPTSAGGSGDVLTTDASGNLSWITPSGAPTGSAGGDLTGSYPNPTVATVGTSTAANIHSAELLANAATDANTPSTIVKRDASGNFSAGAVSATSVTSTGAVSGTNITASGTLTAATVKTDTLQLNNAGSVVNVVNPLGAAYTLTLPTGTGTSGQVLTTNGSGVTSWASPLTSATAFVQGGNTFGANADLGTNDAYDLNLRTGGTTRMAVTASGRVGIGTTSPDAGLHVSTTNGTWTASAWPKNLLVGNDGVSGAIRFPFNASTQFGIGSTTDGKLRIIRSNKNDGTGSAFYDFVVDTTGNVGIGTTSPGAVLTVSQSVDNSATTDPANLFGIRIQNQDSTANSAAQLQFQSNVPGLAQAGIIGRGVSNDKMDMEFYTENGANRNTRMILRNDGNVGIGTTSPNGKLDVKGSIVMSGATSGYAGFQPAAVAGSTVWTLPSADGTSGQVLKTDGSGKLGWVTPAGAGVTEVTSANSDIGVANTTTTPVLTLNSGTGPNQILKLNASSQIPAVDGSLITGLNAGNISSGTLPVSRGGTGATSFANYSVIASNGSGNQVAVPGSTSNTMLQWSVTGPQWSTATWPSSTFANQLLYSSAANVVSGLTTANNSVLTTDGSGVPSFATTLPSAVQGNITSTGTIASGTWNGSAIGAAYGGTGQTSYTTGDLLYASGSSALSKLSAGTSGYVLTSNGAGTAPSWQAASGGVGGSGTANYVPKFTAGTTLGNSAIYETGGNVGIGTTNPTKKLDIHNDTDANVSVARFNNWSAGTSAVAGAEVTSNTNSLFMYATSSNFTSSGYLKQNGTAIYGAAGIGGFSIASGGDLRIYSGGNNDASERLRILSGGNVGVGTTSPAYKLDVAGSVNGTQLCIAGTCKSSWPSGGGASVGTYQLNISDGSGGFMTDPALIYSYNGGSGGALRQRGSSSTQYIEMVTTSPETRLELHNEGNPYFVPTIRFTNNPVDGSTDLLGKMQFGRVGKIAASIDALDAETDASANSGGYLTFSTTAVGSTTNNERVRIDPSGNVGIGTTSPSSKLTVNGDVQVGDATTGTIKSSKELVLRQDGDTYGSSVLRLRNRNGENGAIFETSDPTADLVDFIFKSNTAQRNIRFEARSVQAVAGAPSFHIGGVVPDSPTLAVGDSKSVFAGSVGIGTTNPSSPLTVNGVIESKSGGFKFPDGTTQTTAGGGGSQWVTTGSNIGYAAGKVGVGTTSPQALLDVGGGAVLIDPSGVSNQIYVQPVSSNAGIYVRSSNTGSSGKAVLNLGVNNNAGLFTIQANGSSNTDYGGSNSVNFSNDGPVMTFRTNGSENLRLASGNVGIGTTSPGYKLDVNGIANATQLCIAGDCKSAWPSSGGGLPAANGSSTTPSINFTNSTGTGLYLPSAGVIGFAGGGSAIGTMTTSLLNFPGQQVNALNFTTASGVTGLRYSDNGVANGMGFAGSNTTTLYTNSAERMRITSTGAVGIGTSIPRSALDVNGAITSKPSAVVSSGSTVDFADANFRHTTLQCGSFALWNMKDGSTYSFIVQNTASATCAFTAFSDGGSTALTVKMPPDHTATTAGTETVYSFMVVGSKVYVTWVPGY